MEEKLKKRTDKVRAKEETKAALGVQRGKEMTKNRTQKKTHPKAALKSFPDSIVLCLALLLLFIYFCLFAPLDSSPGCFAFSTFFTTWVMFQCFSSFSSFCFWLIPPLENNGRVGAENEKVRTPGGVTGKIQKSRPSEESKGRKKKENYRKQVKNNESVCEY